MNPMSLYESVMKLMGQMGQMGRMRASINPIHPINPMCPTRRNDGTDGGKAPTDSRPAALGITRSNRIAAHREAGQGYIPRLMRHARNSFIDNGLRGLFLRDAENARKSRKDGFLSRFGRYFRLFRPISGNNQAGNACFVPCLFGRGYEL